MTHKREDTRVICLYVSWREFSQLREWTLLPESEFLTKVYDRWPRLRELPIGTEVKVIVPNR